MEQPNNSIFDVIQKKIILKEIIESFSKKGYLVSEISFLEFTESKIQLKIMTSDGNKIIVEKNSTDLNWKLNALPMGSVMGKEIADVAGDYQYQLAKNRR
jgi:hypothetical protein